MPKEAIFNVTIDAALHETFVAETTAADRPTSEVISELMQDFIARQREARAYDAFVRRKVARAEEDVRRGAVLSNEEVEARAAEQRARLLARFTDHRS